MRFYAKPELRIEAFDVEDVITSSSWVPPQANDDQHGQGGVGFASAPVIEEQGDAVASAVKSTTLFPESTVADPSGAFQHQVTGGNIIQEGLNNLYENFLNRF